MTFLSGTELRHARARQGARVGDDAARLRAALVRLRALALRALLESEPGDDANSLLIAPSEVLTCVDEVLDEVLCPSTAATFCSCPALCAQPDENSRDKSRTR
jgi:hypothetical protein